MYMYMMNTIIIYTFCICTCRSLFFLKVATIEKHFLNVKCDQHMHLVFHHISAQFYVGYHLATLSDKLIALPTQLSTEVHVNMHQSAVYSLASLQV